jgi:hypothetical protein
MRNDNRAILFQVAFILFAMAMSSMSFAKSSDCSEVVEQLRQMKTAQVSVQETLVSNHEMMAQSLESYADAISESAGRAHKSISENMNKAANSLRQRGLKAQGIAKKLETHTDDLIKSVEKCLK